MAASYGLYAYGLVAKHTAQPDMLGIDQQHSVYPVAGQDLCVMVSKIDINQFQAQVKRVFTEFTKDAAASQSETAQLLQAHEDVVTALMKRTTTIPFTFGTILKDEQAAVKMLQDDEDQFKHLLAKFAGREEWGLKIYSDQQQFAQHIAQTEPEFTSMAKQRETLSKGAAYLLGRKMAEDLKDNTANRLAEFATAIFHELGKDADEAKLNKTLPQKLTGKKKEMILNTAYLVEREKVATFCAQGQRLLEHYQPLGIDLEISGPWPPYNFT